MNVRPLGDRVIVKRVEEVQTSTGGIIIPDTAKEKPMEGEVVAVGKGRRLEDGKIQPLEVKVKDLEGRELAAGETGELHFRGECVVEGYFRMPRETSEAFDEEGWLASGDMGYIDQDGYIILMGRKKEMYIQGGFNVYPVEVENLMNKHPKVAMAAGIGVPDSVMGEVGRYYVASSSDHVDVIFM